MAEAKTNQSKPKVKYYYSLGRRKTATATVRLFPGKGISLINGKNFQEVYSRPIDQKKLSEVFAAAGLDPKGYYITAKVKGSGISAQLQAIMHGLAKTIVLMDPSVKKMLKQAGFIRRDPRMVERKKPGLHKARKAEQYSKR